MPFPPQVRRVASFNLGSISGAETLASLTVLPNESLVVGTWTLDTDALDYPVASVTWNGAAEAFTQNATGPGTLDSATDVSVDLWYLANPTATTDDIVITFDLAGGGSISNGAAGVFFLSGTNAADYEDASAANSYTNDSTPPVSVTTVALNCLAVAIVGAHSLSTSYSGGGLYSQQGSQSGSRGVSFFAHVVGSAGAHDFAISSNIGDDTEDGTFCVLSINPDPSPAPSVPLRGNMNVVPELRSR